MTGAQLSGPLATLLALPFDTCVGVRVGPPLKGGRAVKQGGGGGFFGIGGTGGSAGPRPSASVCLDGLGDTLLQIETGAGDDAVAAARGSGAAGGGVAAGAAAAGSSSSDADGAEAERLLASLTLLMQAAQSRRQVSALLEQR